jgi:predicted transcriptional regulator
MRKDSINNEAIEKAYLIYKEHGHQIVDYDFSHPPTDYKRGTVEEPEHNSKLRDSYNELLPSGEKKSQFDALANRCDQLCGEIENLQAAMVQSRRMGNFQMLQNQMKQVADKIKEKERCEAQMAVKDLGAAQMKVYNDTMDHSEFSELSNLTDRIAELEASLAEFLGE